LEFFADDGMGIQLRRCGIKDQYVSHGSDSQLRKDIGIDIGSFMNDISRCIAGYKV
jgi:deoxyxylulose-5-phosphate synthase